MNGVIATPLTSSAQQYIDDVVRKIPPDQSGQVNAKIGAGGQTISFAWRKGGWVAGAYASRDPKGKFDYGGDVTFTWK